MGSGEKTRRWKISFHRSSSKSRSPKPPPSEFLCPISSSVMADPVIDASGHTFERSCAIACKDLAFLPLLPDGSLPDLSTLIPNHALKSAILTWCQHSSASAPSPLPHDAALRLVQALADAGKGHPLHPSHLDENDLLLRGVSDNPPRNLFHADTEVNRRPKHYYTSSDESVTATPLPLATKPVCFSSSPSSSSSEIRYGEGDDEEEDFVTRLRSSQASEQEDALARLRSVTRSLPEKRTPLCTPRLLAALRPLLASRYAGVQTHAVAVVVNLSLETPNKVKIVRAGMVPPLVDALQGGSPEAQEHAAGALFSLSLDDENRTAIGVLGALPPLLHALRLGSERGCQDAALALYHLTLANSNRSKLVKLNAVPVLLTLARSSSELTGRVLIILCNVASSLEGRVALLDADAVEVFLLILKRKDIASSELEHCIAVLFSLSHSSLRFRGSAKAAGALETLSEVAERCGERARQKVKRMLVVLRENGGSGVEEEGEGEGVSDSVVGAYRHQQQRYPLHKGKNISGAYSTEF